MAECESLLLRLDGFEGPLDLLLELARGEKLDLGRISILAIVEQYLAVIEGAQLVRLELAADWLVMAAWLAWLKSRLLLPAGSPGATRGSRRQRISPPAWPSWPPCARRRLGWPDGRNSARTFLPAAAPENFVEADRSKLLLDQAGLVRAYLAAAKRVASGRRYRPPRLTLWSVQDALARLQLLIGRLPRGGALWTSLEHFLPDLDYTALQRRAAVASTLLAGLEMARDGALLLRQEAPFGPIMLRASHG